MNTADPSPPAEPSHRLDLLVTGFGPFPGVPHNISASLAHTVVQEIGRRSPSLRLSSATLPTTWEEGRRIAHAMRREFQPAVIIHFGVSDLARGFVLERLARNECRARLDASGRHPASDRLCARSPQHHATRLPVDGITERLRQRGLPVHASDDAGGYLCNAVFFDTLNDPAVSANALNPATAGFIHIPVRPGAPLDHDHLLEGAILIVETSLEHASNHN